MTEWRQGVRWFAAEFLVVVTGVLVALGVQALVQRAEDGRLEIAYLRQLERELAANEAAMAAADSFTAGSDRAGVLLLRAYREPAPPDSILAWLTASGRYPYQLPVAGTAEALVASGDLRLVRSDTLRAAITGYVAGHRPVVHTLQGAIDRWVASRSALGQAIDLSEAAARLPQHDNAKLLDPGYSPLPAERAAAPFPFDPATLLRDREAYAALDEMNSAKYVAWLMRSEVRREARALRALVEAELERRR